MKLFQIDPAKVFMETSHMPAEDIGSIFKLMMLQAMTEQPITDALMERVSQRVRECFDEVPGLGWVHPDVMAQMDKAAKDAAFNTDRARKAANARHGNKVTPKPAPKPTTLAEPDLMATDDGAEAPIDTSDIPEVGKEWFEQATLRRPGEALLEQPSLGTEFPKDFTLTGTHIATAKAVGVDMDLLAEIFDDFRRYYGARGTLHPDWNLAFEKWFERKRPKKPKAAPRVQLNKEPPPTPDYEPDVPDDD